MSTLKSSACRALALAVLACGGCTGIEGVSSQSVLIPPETLNVSKSLSIPLEGIAAGVVLYFIVDPLAPNWEIEQTQVNPDRYLIALKKKRFTTGGDGEAGQIINRRAAQLARDSGGAYRIVELTEGIESTVPIARRVAHGVIEIVR